MKRQRATSTGSSFASYLAMVIVPIALLAGCAAPSGNGGGAGSTDAAASAKSSAEPGDIIGTWQLIRWEGPGDVPPLPEGRLINLNFNDQGEIHGTGGCNRIFGKYTAGPGKGQLSMTSPAATRMACPDSMAFEQSYVATLARVNRFERRDNLLLLTAPGGDTLTYAAQTLLNRPVADNRATAVAADKPQDRTLDVDSQLADCVGVGPRKCLRVRDVGNAAGRASWELWYAQIDGFDWQPGVEYRVKIHGEPLQNPPADASSMRWTLVEVISQTPSGKLAQ